MALPTTSTSTPVSTHKRKATSLNEKLCESTGGPSSFAATVEGPSKKLKTLCDVEEQIVNDTQLSDTVSLNAISYSSSSSTNSSNNPAEPDGVVNYFSLLPFELKLLIAETCPQSWVLCSLVFRDVGLYSMRDYVQKRMRSKFRHIFIKKFKDVWLFGLFWLNDWLRFSIIW